MFTGFSDPLRLVSRPLTGFNVASLLCCWMLCLGLTTASSAQAQTASSAPLVMLHAGVQTLDLLPMTEFWIESPPSSTHQTAQAVAAASAGLFKSNQRTIAHKIDGKALWLRFDVQVTDARSLWLLELGAPLLDNASLHWQSPNGVWQSQGAGDAVARKLWPLPTRLPSFTLPMDAGAEVTRYYMRVENARFPVSMQMKIYRDSAHLASQQIEHMLLGALTGLLCLMLITSVCVAWVRREQAFAAYSVYLLALGLFVLTNMGVTPLYLWNESPVLADRLNYGLAAMTAALGPWLVHLIVQPVVRLRLMNFLIAVQAAVMLTCAAFEMLFPNWLTYQFLNAGTLMSVALVYMLVAITWQRGESITRWVALCFAPVALSALPLILRNLGAIPNGWLTLYSVPLATAIELPLLLYALLTRSNQRRESQARADGLPTQDALTGLPNMHSFLQHMQGTMVRSDRFNHRYGLLLIELRNHAWYVKEHGREMADRAVLLTSTRLHQQLRDVDAICRLDESNFMILIEGACTPAQLTKLAARISASGHAPTHVLPVGASLRLSICCALMPTQESREAGDDAHAQLGWFISAAEETPAEQRKMVRSIGF